MLVSGSKEPRIPSLLSSLQLTFCKKKFLDGAMIVHKQINGEANRNEMASSCCNDHFFTSYGSIKQKGTAFLKSPVKTVARHCGTPKVAYPRAHRVSAREHSINPPFTD